MRLLFQDETKLCLCPDPGTDYHPIGCQTRVSSPGRSTARWLFGSIDVASAEGLYQVFEHATTAEFLRHLDDLLQPFPHERLLLVTDQASWHSSDAVRDFQAHVHDRLEFIPLAKSQPTFERHRTPVGLCPRSRDAQYLLGHARARVPGRRCLP
jgi:hypothetical protein